MFFCWSINKYAPAQLLKHTMVVVVLAYIEVLFFFLSCIQFDRWWNWLPLDTLSMNKTWLSWFGDFRGKQELIDRYIFSQGSVNFFYISIFFLNLDYYFLLLLLVFSLFFNFSFLLLVIYFLKWMKRELQKKTLEISTTTKRIWERKQPATWIFLVNSVCVCNRKSKFVHQ